jgi:hypothetical protein
MAKVYLKFNGAVIKEYKLTKEATTFGRKPTNDIVIDHPTVSGFHGKIKKEGEHFFVEDLNSTNGTYLNGQPVKSAAVKNRDKIGAAGHILEFVTDDLSVATDEAGLETPDTSASQDASPRKGAGLDGPTSSEMAGTPPAPDAVVPAARPAPAPLDIGVPSAAPVSRSSDGRSLDSVDGSKPAGGIVRIISGGVDGQSEVSLKELVTYIGSSDQALIKIKGFLAPGLAAAISRRPEGYFLKAVKAGYPKVNGNPVNEQIFLENGALIEVGGTNMVFYHSDRKNKPS